VVEDGIESLTRVVPRAIASPSSGDRTGAARRRDRPLGSRSLNLLGRVPIFSGLSRRHLRRLAEHADLVEFRPGERIVEAGQPGGTFFVVVEGEAKVVRGARTIDRLSPGEFFGEISLLDGGPRTATVVADTRVVAIRIFKRSFDAVVSQEPTVATKILQVVAGRLRASERSISG
jgi:CRP-like cAMP-binding protein